MNGNEKVGAMRRCREGDRPVREEREIQRTGQRSWKMLVLVLKWKNRTGPKNPISFRSQKT